MIVTARIETELGTMIAGATDEGICLLEFSDRRMLPTELKDLQNIPFGSTRSYQEQAVALNRPDSVRTVANANGMNRIILIK